MIGQTVSHYRVLAKLGEGGMGAVYKAEDTKLRRIVALKFLPPQYRARCLREAQAAASLNHPNICTIFEVDEEHGFIAMEIVEGANVKDKIAERPLKLDEAIDIAIQTCRGLQAAHEKGVVHRDIKPANLMLTAQGQVKIMDFGLAHVGDRTRITQTGTSMGTPAYMSPEHVKGEPTDRRTDLWSIGVTLYEMLTGRPPFSGTTEAAMTYGIVHTEPEPPSALRSGLPRDLDRIIAKVLSKEPQSRYQNGADLIVDLRSVLSHQPKSSQTGITSKKLLAWSLVSALFGALALLGGRALLQDAAIRSVAIMPLATADSGPDTEHLSEGLAESLTYSLAQVQDLRVMSRSAVLRQTTQRAGDAIAAGLALGVDGVVTGRIVAQGGELAITVELVEVRSGRNVWGSRYTRSGSELQRLQEEVASEISGALRVKLSRAQQEQLERRNSHNGEAYNLYLKGRFFARRRAPEDLRKAIEYFEQAIDRDPNYALAHAGLADAWLLGDHVIPPGETAPKAKRMAARAVQLDSRLAEAHISQAMVKFVIDWDWQAAETEFRRAIECDPKDVEAHRNFGVFQLRLGHKEQALGELLRAAQLDPTNSRAQLSLAQGLYWSGRYRDAVMEFRKILETNPDYSAAHVALGLTLSQMGEHAEAVRQLQTGFQLSPDDSSVKAALGYGLARAGQRDAALRLARELEQLRTQRYVAAFNISTLYSGLLDRNNALRWTEKAFDERSMWLVHLKEEPRLAMLRSEPRFQELLRKVGFP